LAQIKQISANCNTNQTNTAKPNPNQEKNPKYIE